MLDIFFFLTVFFNILTIPSQRFPPDVTDRDANDSSFNILGFGNPGESGFMSPPLSPSVFSSLPTLFLPSQLFFPSHSQWHSLESFSVQAGAS